MTWRKATSAEIREYYQSEFEEWKNSLPPFLTYDGPKEFALAFRDGYPIKKSEAPPRDFIRRKTREERDSNCKFDSFNHVINFIQQPAQYDPYQGTDFGLVEPDLLETGGPVPAGVYYSLDHWERSWVLLVDIDAKDIAMERCHGIVANDEELSDTEIRAKSGVLTDAPTGYPYRFEDIEQAIEYGFAVRDIFEDDFNAKRTMVVYSGQGCHVYLFDDDRAHQYDAKSREVMIDYLVEKQGIPIDTVVTADRKRVARLPYSLHADVGRIVTPIESPDYDFYKQAQPDFLTEAGDCSSGGHDEL